MYELCHYLIDKIIKLDNELKKIKENNSDYILIRLLEEMFYDAPTDTYRLIIGREHNKKLYEFIKEKMKC